MQLNISGHHIEITPALKAHAQKKLQKIKQHFNQVININLLLEVDNGNQTAEATLHIGGYDLFAKAQSSDMYQSINSLVKKLDAQVIKYKNKLQNHH